MRVQEDHDLTDDFLIGPPSDDPLRPLGADALDIPRPLGLRLDDIERRLAERPHQPLAVDRADLRIMPEPRYLSMPSTVVGGAARRKLALN